MRWHDWVALVLLAGFFLLAGVRLWRGDEPRCSERSVRHLVGVLGFEDGLIPIFENPPECGAVASKQ